MQRDEGTSPISECLSVTIQKWGVSGGHLTPVHCLWDEGLPKERWKGTSVCLSTSRASLGLTSSSATLGTLCCCPLCVSGGCQPGILNPHQQQEFEFSLSKYFLIFSRFYYLLIFACLAVFQKLVGLIFFPRALAVAMKRVERLFFCP